MLCFVPVLIGADRCLYPDVVTDLGAHFRVTADLNTTSAAEVEFTFAYQAAQAAQAQQAQQDQREFELQEQQSQLQPLETQVFPTDGALAAPPGDAGSGPTAPAGEPSKPRSGDLGGGGALPDTDSSETELDAAEPAAAASAPATAAATPDPGATAMHDSSVYGSPATAPASSAALQKGGSALETEHPTDHEAGSSADAEGAVAGFTPDAPADQPPATDAEDATAPRSAAEGEPSAAPEYSNFDITLTPPADGHVAVPGLVLLGMPPPPGSGSASDEHGLPAIGDGSPKPALPVSTSLDEYASVAQKRRKMIPGMKLGCLYVSPLVLAVFPPRLPPLPFLTHSLGSMPSAATHGTRCRAVLDTYCLFYIQRPCLFAC